MDFTQWSQLALICVMGAMSPGPSLAVILRNTISGGRTQGLMSGVGHGLGITFYSVVAITGLVALLKTVPNFFPDSPNNWIIVFNIAWRQNDYFQYWWRTG